VEVDIGKLSASAAFWRAFPQVKTDIVITLDRFGVRITLEPDHIGDFIGERITLGRAPVVLALHTHGRSRDHSP
jgi:hypothetical protein